MQLVGRYGIAALALLIFVASADGQTWERRDIYSFGQRDAQGGRIPEDPPLLGSDGALYGTTSLGGTFNKGALYRYQPSDDSYVVLHHFLGGSEGASPLGSAFVQSDDGRLYGLAFNPRLILYSLRTDGSDYRIHFTFPAGAEQPSRATNVTSLSAGPGGMLYGIYINGGLTGSPANSTLFRIARDGSGFQIIGSVPDASSPLSFGANGQLYGVSFSTVYRLNIDGSNFQTLKTFPPLQFNSVRAEGGLAHASNGFMYGTTNAGGSFGFGMIFRLREDGSEFQVIFEPTTIHDAGQFRGRAFEGSDGYIYGAMGENGFGVDSLVWRIQKDGSGWQVLKRIGQNGRATNSVIEAPDGFLYGVTSTGSPGRELFRLARDGSSYEFAHVFAATERFPLAPVALVRGVDQRFYGLTNQDGTGGRGTLFRIHHDGSGFMVLHDFGSGAVAEQGNIPKAICAGPDGAIYGIVRQQGSGGAGVFRFWPDNGGGFAWLRTFDSATVADTAALLVAADGMIYGAIDTSTVKTERIFRLDTNGGSFTLLRTLTSTASSFTGTSVLSEGPDGLLYGVTTRNGSATVPLIFRMSHDGSVFMPLADVATPGNPAVTPPASLLVTSDNLIYGFAGHALFRCNTDGTGFHTLRTYSVALATQRPIDGFDGKIYCAIRFGGAAQRGAVFRMSRDGSDYEEVVVMPNESLSGQAPVTPLVTGPDGAFYGLTQVGGDANRGTLFRVATPAQSVGIDGDSLRFDEKHRFTGSVVGPPGRPVEVQRSDDLQTWTFLQRIKAPEVDATFIDSSNLLPPKRFYRAIAP